MAVTVDAFHVVLNNIVTVRSENRKALIEAVCRARAAGDPLDFFIEYPQSLCDTVIADITRGGRDFTAPEGSISAITSRPSNIAGQEFIGIDTSVSYAWVTDSAGVLI